MLPLFPKFLFFMLDLNIGRYLFLYVGAYLLGSIPSAVWLSKLLYKEDIREHGSGNAGTVNTIRTYGWISGLLVLCVDVSKGALAAMLPVFFGMEEAGSEYMINLQVLAGAMAIMGHLFPVFADFRGGKGVATIFGVLVVLQPQIALICFALFVAMMLTIGIASVSSLVSVTVYSLLAIFAFNITTPSLKIFSVAVVVVLFLTHHANIKRLFQGKEKRLLKFGGRRNK